MALPSQLMQDKKTKTTKTKTKKVSFAALVTKTKTRAEEQRVKNIKKQQEDKEERQYWRTMLDEQQKMKAVLLKPSLPLEESDPIDVDKTSTISFSLKVRPQGNNDHTYKKILRLFSQGTPFDWLLTLRDVREVWTQNSVNGAQDRAGVVRAVLRDDAWNQFQTAVDSEVAAVADGVLTVAMVETGLQAVSASIFPHRALEIQKLWMRRHMKKPLHMSYRTLQAKVLQINSFLPAFPGGTAADRFSATELLGILEYALPPHWRSKFDLDGYVPTEHDRARLLRECEALERNEPGDMAKRVPRKKRKKEKKTPKTNDSPTGQKYCSEHGHGNHSSSECWSLHPEKKPDKFKNGSKKAKKNGNETNQENHAMLKEAMKEQLHEMLTMMKQSRNKKNVFKTTTKRGKGKKRKQEDSDSDNSVHAMDNTPEPSDSEELSKAAMVQRFIEDEAMEDPDAEE